jgi:hypothetical protein
LPVTTFSLRAFSYASRSPDVVALQLVVSAGYDYVTAYIRGEGATFYVGEKKVPLEEFIALGEAYWKHLREKGEKQIDLC